MMALSNCMVVGEKRKYLAMLVSLKCVMDTETGAPTDDLDKDAIFEGDRIGSKATTMSAAAKDPLWIKYVKSRRELLKM